MVLAAGNTKTQLKIMLENNDRQLEAKDMQFRTMAVWIAKNFCFRRIIV
jgi:hypothetical protein